MRIGSAVMTLNYIDRLNKAYRNQANLVEQGDGDKFHRPSDDPVEYARTMRYKNDLANNDDYTRNVNDGLSWMKASDTKMQQMVSIMNTIKEKTEAAANGTNTEKDVAAIGAEVEALVEELVNLGNTDIGGRYLFSGQRDLTQPYQINSEQIERVDMKTLDETQTAVFGYAKTGGNTHQILGSEADASRMLKLVGSDGKSYYMNIVDNSVYEAEFVESGYKEVVNTGISGKALYDEIYEKHRVGTLSTNATEGFFSTSKNDDGYFNQQGQLNGKSLTFTLNGNNPDQADYANVTFEFDMAEQTVVTYLGDDNKISMKMVNGANDPMKDAINATGVDVFGTDIFGTGGTSVLNDLYSIVQHMKAGDTHWLSADGMALADQSYEQVLGAEAELGAICANYNVSQEMLTNQNTLITEDITNLSGTDIAELAVDLQMASMIYSMSLAMGSKILQNSLADYL